MYGVHSNESNLFQAMFKANKGNVQGYFLAGRDVGWWAVCGLRFDMIACF